MYGKLKKIKLQRNSWAGAFFLYKSSLSVLFLSHEWSHYPVYSLSKADRNVEHLMFASYYHSRKLLNWHDLAQTVEHFYHQVPPRDNPHQKKARKELIQLLLSSSILLCFLGVYPSTESMAAVVAHKRQDLFSKNNWAEISIQISKIAG